MRVRSVKGEPVDSEITDKGTGSCLSGGAGHLPQSFAAVL